ncbi:hypothetical protein Ddc_13287 [Ditylenchus destructor]|nr:hypothetical protein Ddc_13287 [Ditylenchus destructor]
MLTDKIPWVNSRFYHLSLHHVPTIHFIPMLNCIVNNSYLSSTELHIYNFLELPTPAPYIRIKTVNHNPNVLYIDEEILEKLKSAKHVFVGAHVYLCYRMSNVQHDPIQDMESVLNEVFTEPYFISFYGSCFVPKRLFQTKGVLNCDKVERVATSREMSHSSGKPTCNDVQLYGSDSFNVAECFAEWLHYKHMEANSRRHLILKEYPKVTVSELAKILKKEFQAATAPVNYMVTLPGCKYTLDDDDMQNDVTGERLSHFSFPHPNAYSLTVNCIWRRIPIKKSPGKTSDAEYMLMFKRECKPNKDFDKKFFQC